MQLHYSDTFVLPLPPGHRFPMRKYALLREALAQSGLFAAEDFRIPPAASDVELLHAHDPNYLARVVEGRLSAAEQRVIGFPWSPQMVERSRRSAGATLAACRAALSEGCAFNLAGGTHHAAHDRGAGFCVFNDAAVSALTMRAEGLASRIAILDCDVHQGDGTARILAGEPGVLTCSLHGARNYPFTKAQSDLDIELPDGCGDDDYLTALEQALAVVERFQPELLIYLAGADPYAGDRLGRLALSFAGLEERDRRVFAHCRRAGLPVAVAMAGGYANEIEDTVRIHQRTVTLAVGIFG